MTPGVQSLTRELASLRGVQKVESDAPALPEGCIRFMWATDCEVEIECHLDFQTAEPQTWEHPGCDAVMTLSAAYLRGVDIVDILHSTQIAHIETKALIAHGEVLREAAGDSYRRKQKEECHV